MTENSFRFALLRLTLCTLAIVGLAFSQSAQAATVTWTGTNGTDWSVLGNPPWSNGTKPAAADTALFDGVAGGTTVANAVADQSITSINFGSVTATSPGSFTVGTTGGNKLLLGTGGQISIGSTIAAGFTETVNAPLSIGAAAAAAIYSFSNAAASATTTLVLGGAISGGTSSTVVLTLTGANAGNNTVGGAISNGSSSALSLTKASSGLWILSGANSYTGQTSINGGTLSVGSVGNQASTTSNLGTSALAIKIGSTTTAATLLYTGASGETSDRVIDLAGTTGGATLNQSGAAGNLKFTTDLTASGAGSKTLTLTGSTAGTGEISGKIVNNSGTNKTALTKSGTGTWTLSGANTYTGQNTIAAGTLSVSNIGTQASTSSNLGGPSALAIKIGSTTTTGTLLYTGGSGETTDRVIDLSGTTGGATIDQSGAGGNLKFTGTNTATGAGIKTLTLQGSTAGTGEISGAIVDNTATNKTSLTKAGTGTWTLTGSSSYTGATSINGGTLVLGSGGNLNGATAVTVTNAGSTFAVTPGVAAATNALAGSLSLGANTAFTMADGVNSTFTVATTLTTASGSKMTFNLGGTTTGADLLAATGAATIGATTTINITTFGSTALTLADYNIITAASGLGTASFTLGTTNAVVAGNLYHFSLANSTATAETITVLAGGVGTPNAFWTGSQGTGSWKTQTGSPTFLTNFSTDATGATNTLALPDLNTNVTFTANSATNLSTTLDQAFTINSLNFSGTGTSNTAGSTIAAGTGGSASTLTINAATINGNAAGNGITVASGSGANTVSANVILGASQTWTNNAASANALTLSGNISGLFGLTLAGTGTTVFSGSNTYGVAGSTAADGITSFNGAGTLRAIANGGNTSGGISSALSANNYLTVNATGATLDLRADATTTFATEGLTFASGSNKTFTINVDKATGSGLASQVITLGGNVAIPNATAVATFNITSSTGYSLSIGEVSEGNNSSAVFNTTNANLTIASLHGNTPLNNQAFTNQTSGGTYTFTGNATTTVLGQAITSNSSRTQTLNIGTAGANDLTGAVTLASTTTSGGNALVYNFNSGTLNVNSANGLGSGTVARTLNINTNVTTAPTLDNTTASAITVAAGANLLKTNINDNFTFGGTRALNLGAGAVSLGTATGAAGAARTITTNGTTQALTIGGAISDGLNATPTTGLTKAGTGTLILTGASTYTGVTTAGAAGGSGVTGGNLIVDNNNTTTARLANTSGIVVNAGGTLLLAQSGATASTNRINDAATVNLAGGTLASGTLAGTVAGSHSAQEGIAATVTGGALTGTSTVGLGALTLSANSTLDFDSATDGNLFVFGTGFTPGAFVLTITNWGNTNFDGTLNSGLAADDRLVFNQDMSTFYNSFDFGSGAGVGVTEILLDTGFYEVGFTAVPEPSTWVAGFLAVGVIAYSQRRRLRGLLAQRA